MLSTRSKKAAARRAREADIMSDIENIDFMLGSGEYNQIERDIDQMRGFSFMLNRDENEESHSIKGNAPPNNKIRNMSENRNHHSLIRDLDMLSGEINLRLSQEINSLLNRVNSQIENAINSAISERINPQMQGVVEAILNRQFESVSSMSRRPQNVESDERNVEENKMQNRSSRPRQNLMDSEDESPQLVTGVFEPHTSVPDFLTGRIQRQQALSPQASSSNIRLNTTLPNLQPTSTVARSRKQTS